VQDLPLLYAHQADPQAQQMAVVPARDRQVFYAHWRRIIGDETTTARAILIDGEIAGYVMCFGAPTDRQVGYWIGRAHWGRGIATRALSLFLAEAGERPLYAYVAEHNRASIRVLEKCGFRRFGEPVVASDGVTELRLELA
jgi:RimJ/RimL family protein N-acetyltransferase